MLHLLATWAAGGCKGGWGCLLVDRIWVGLHMKGGWSSMHESSVQERWVGLCAWKGVELSTWKMCGTLFKKGGWSCVGGDACVTN